MQPALTIFRKLSQDHLCGPYPHIYQLTTEYTPLSLSRRVSSSGSYPALLIPQRSFSEHFVSPFHWFQLCLFVRILGFLGVGGNGNGV
jgi:hypothetical protein